MNTQHRSLKVTLFNNVFLFNSRYAALDALQSTSKPDSFFEAIEVRGLPDTPSGYNMYLYTCIWVTNQA